MRRASNLLKDKQADWCQGANDIVTEDVEYRGGLREPYCGLHVQCLMGPGVFTNGERFEAKSWRGW